MICNERAFQDNIQRCSDKDLQLFTKFNIGIIIIFAR